MDALATLATIAFASSLQANATLREHLDENEMQGESGEVAAVSRGSSHLLALEPGRSDSGEQGPSISSGETDVHGKYANILLPLQVFCFRQEYFTAAMVKSITAILNRCESDLHQVLHRDTAGDNECKRCASIDILYTAAKTLHGKSLGKLPTHHDFRLIHEAAFIMLFAQLTNAADVQNGVYITYVEFFRKYPEFTRERDPRIDAAEQESLLKFRNTMALCQTLISAHHHKNHLMDLVTRLAEGKDVRYIVGSGQSDKTSRRVLIYRREGDVPLISKACFSSSDNASSSRPATLCEIEASVSAAFEDIGTDSDSNSVGEPGNRHTPLRLMGSPAHSSPSVSSHDSTAVHTLERKRYRHLTYMQSMTQARMNQPQELLFCDRTSRSADNLLSVEVIIQREDGSSETVVINNVKRVRQV
jgi:hypothetical protein